MMLEIYSDLVCNGVLASLHDNDRGIDPIGVETFKHCAYHDALDYRFSTCLCFCYDIESFVDMRKILVDIIARN